ncbi:MAG: ATP-binding cassette domain-containing protein [Treponema sp.]
MINEKVELINIAKTYYLETRGGFLPRVALINVNVQFNKGEIHSILGENGAGKSTLMHILSGRIKPTSGTIKIDGKDCIFSSPSDAIKKGVAIIFQSLPQVFEGTVLENVMLVQKDFINKKEYSKIKLLLKNWNIESINFNSNINNLSKEECFFIELMCLLCKKPKVLILDESASFIPSDKKKYFFTKLKEHAINENIAIITITHNIDEAIKISDKITIISEGKNIETLDIARLKQEQADIRLKIEKNMYKRMIENEKPKIVEISKKEGIKIEIHNKEMKDLVIKANEGEITGILNNVKLLETLLSSMLPKSIKKTYEGGITFQDDFFLSFTKLTPSLLLKHKIGFIPSDRYYRASFPNLSIIETLSCYHTKKLIINEKERKKFATSILEEENIHTSIYAPCNNLSGGQLQRIILARCLKEEPKIIILVEPMRGLDVASMEIMKKKLYQLKKMKKTILIITQEENIYSNLFDKVIKNNIA